MSLSATADPRAAKLPRVLFVSFGADPTAQESGRAAGLQALLRANGSEGEILAFDPKPGAGPTPSRLKARLNFLRRLSRRIVRSDTVHLFGAPGVSLLSQVAPVILLSRFFGKRVILDYGCCADETGPEDRSFLLRAILRLCHTLLVPSDYQMQRARAVGLKADYISSAVQPDRIKALEIKSVQPRIIIAGPVEKINNVACALRAFKLVKQKYPRTEMLIVGEGSQRARLQVVVAMEKIYGVEFAGAVDQATLHQHIAASDVFVNCCSIDHLPGSLLEAAACGLPVITTPAGGIRDALKDRREALLVKVNDHVGLADRLIELVENPELVQSLSQQGRATAARFDWSRISKNWLQLYSLPASH